MGQGVARISGGIERFVKRCQPGKDAIQGRLAISAVQRFADLLYVITHRRAHVSLLSASNGAKRMY